MLRVFFKTKPDKLLSCAFKWSNSSTLFLIGEETNLSVEQVISNLKSQGSLITQVASGNKEDIAFQTALNIKERKLLMKHTNT